MSAKKSKGSPQEDHSLDQLSFFATDPAPINSEKPVPSPAPVYQKGRLHKLNPEELLPDPDQPRQALDEERLDELAASISRHGLLEPVLFRQSDEGQLYVVAGSRRLAASKRAQLRQIPAIVAEGDPVEVALVENLVRQDLTCIEESEAISRLKDRHGYSLAELSAIIGKSVPTLSEILSLVRLPEIIRNECRNDHAIARSILVEIARLSSEEEMLELFNRYRQGGLSRDHLRKRGQAHTRSKPSYTRLFRSFSRKITAIEISGMADKERTKVRKELEQLRSAIEESLARLDQ
jgi:ParB family chromosome partitioning protein